MCYCTPNIRTPFCQKCGGVMFKELASLKQQLAEAKKDAERWLKCKTMRKQWWLDAMKEAGLKGGRSLDEAIDQAMRDSHEQNEA